MNKNAGPVNLSKNYFSNFTNKAKKDMINNLELKNNQLRLEILNNSKLISMLKNNE